MHKVYCDLCGKEIDEESVAGYLWEYDKLYKCNRKLFLKKGETEFCLRCMKRIKKAVEIEIEKIKEEFKNGKDDAEKDV